MMQQKMYKNFQLAALSAAISTCLLIVGLQAQEQRHDFRSLLNGKDLSGWHGDNPHETAKATSREEAIAKQQAAFHEHWRVEDEQLVNDGHGPYATTDEEFGDIDFKLQYKTVARADSGVYLRGTPQVQIWDTTKGGGKWDRHADKGSGGLFNNKAASPGQLPLVHADKPFGEWNSLSLTQLGSRTWVWLNEQLVVDGAIMENYWDKTRQRPLAARGPIHLQTHGGEIRWRDIQVRSVPAEEANRKLRGDDAAQGFTSLFDGHDLSKWQGAVDDYEVRDGVLVCRPGKGGVLFSQEQYADFVARVEFKIPKGGNNGLAIRYPGKGRASYDAMCELQILDDDDEQYSKLDPRQYHGSIYGMVAAERGYLRPEGEWNYQEVTVRGSRITVELNGSIIVNADVSQVTEFKDDSPHPGKDLKEGYFGLAGHNDPVEFRNIAIKSLPKNE